MTSNNQKFSIIAAIDEENGIGRNNDLAWDIPSDLKYFNEITRTTSNPDFKNAVIMGRKTWESIPAQFRPLRHRLNIILTRNSEYKITAEEALRGDTIILNSLDQALEYLADLPNIEEVFVIGGSQIYHQAIQDSRCHKLYLTNVLGTHNCDTFFPQFTDLGFQLNSESKTLAENGLHYKFMVYYK